MTIDDKRTLHPRLAVLDGEGRGQPPTTPSRARPALVGPGGAVAPGSSAAQLRHHGRTDCGLRRSHNEDAFLADARLGLFVVCDGVGGRAHGELAASEAAHVIHAHVQRETGKIATPVRRDDTLDELRDLVRTAMQAASRQVHAYAASDPRYHGMSTTASVALVAGQHAVIGQVGDSRVYHARDGSVRQVTEDHTLAAVRVKLGQLAPAQALMRKSPITRALGLKAEVDVDIVTVPLLAGDRLLLCSDGLHDYLRDDRTLLQLFQLEVHEATAHAIRHANRCGGADNITALFVEFLGEASRTPLGRRPGPRAPGRSRPPRPADP